MKDNYGTCVVGKKCILVPYRPEHVETYHAWMQDPHLLNATGSEPLSLEEEVAMQQSWRDDSNKCTFIVLRRCEEMEDWLTMPSSNHDHFIQRTLPFMVGDVNLFLSNEDEEEEDEHDFGSSPFSKKTSTQLQAEIDIMIAEPAYRSKGIGQEASCMMMLYGAQQFGIRRFFCKIQETNISSLSLFKRLGFVECGYAACFKEFELELKRDSTNDIINVVSEWVGARELTTFSYPVDERNERSAQDKGPI